MRRQRRALRVAVGDEDHAGRRAHAGFGLAAEASQRGLQPLLVRIAEIDTHGVIDELRQRQDLAQLALRADRRVEQDLLRILRTDSSNRLPSRPICVTSDITSRSRSGSIGGLVTWAKPSRKRSNSGRTCRDIAAIGRIVAHRAGGLGLGLRDHLEHALAFFAAEPEQLSGSGAVRSPAAARRRGWDRSDPIPDS